MLRIFFLFLSLFFFASSAFAKEVQVTVNGMVCSLCAHGLNKKFLEHRSVDRVAIRFEEKLVVLSLKEGTEITDDEVKQVVEWAGYEVAAITRENKVREGKANE
ncbi:MAG: heavy-metal-associated domain-containing protein [Bdellovibrionota bacterium]|jgi:mercuric ion binding protein